MGMYLPVNLILMIPLGALLGLLHDRWATARSGDPERSRRLGVLLATGLIVGESLFGVLFAGIVAATGDDAPLAVVGEGFASAAEWLGVLLLVALVLGLYRWVRSLAQRA